MESVDINGPFTFRGPNSIFEHLDGPVHGFYFWCVHVRDTFYRAYYVGEAVDVAGRLRTHLKLQLDGMYTAHCLDGLRKNVQILMHRPIDGMVPRFRHLDSTQFNSDFLDSIALFYAELPRSGESSTDKWLRCRYEAGIVRHIENSGQNIMSVGHIWRWREEPSEVTLRTAGFTIEAISGEVITI